MSENAHNASFVRALEFVPKKAITRLVLVETLGSIAPPTKQSLHAFSKGSGGHQQQQTRTGRCKVMGRRRRAPPPLSFVVHHTQQISMAAVAGDAENIKKRARKMRINWRDQESKRQTASCPRPLRLG